MLATSTSPQLRRIQKSGQKARIKDVVFVGIQVGEFEREKLLAKLEELRQRRERLMLRASFITAGMVGAMGIAAFALAGAMAAVVASFPSLNSVAGELQSVSQRYLLMADIVETFKDQDIAIEVEIEGEGIRTIDLFLRFPDKEYILIQIRSMGGARVSYSQEREELRFRRKGGVKTWIPDPLSELARQEQWLRKHKPELLGTSSRDRRRPLSKLLVLWTDTFLDDHPEQLYATINDQKYLTIRKFGTASIVTRNQVVDFIRAYLSSRRSLKTP